MSTLTLVMTIIGEDKPGLVESVSTLIRDHGGNWLESRMCHLGGRFAGILRAEVPADRENDLLSALASLETRVGLKVTIQRDRPAPAPGGRSFTLELVGNDRPGIISQISRTLTTHKVNVESLDTHTESAPMAGGSLFHAHALLQLPDNCPITTLQADLEKIAADLMVDLKLDDGSK